MNILLTKTTGVLSLIIKRILPDKITKKHNHSVLIRVLSDTIGRVLSRNRVRILPDKIRRLLPNSLIRILPDQIIVLPQNMTRILPDKMSRTLPDSLIIVLPDRIRPAES